MRQNSHPWGLPPWTINFHPAKRPLPSRVDFAIIGAGFAGLSAAAHLAKLAQNKSVFILESGCIGNGASGRTGGMALAATAVGPLPGLGDVLAGYKKILRDLQVDSHLHLPGAYELSRSSKRKNSPIHWSDSGDLHVSKQVPGGTIDPGRVVSGLARAAQKAGVQIVEHAELLSVEATRPNVNLQKSRRSSHAANAPLKLHVRLNSAKHARQKTLLADHLLLTTNSGSLRLTGLQTFAEPRLTLALATTPLTKSQLRAAGLSARRPFYTVDLPYLWGRLLENNGVIFGAGLVPLPSSRSVFSADFARRKTHSALRGLLRFNVHRGITADRLDWLESRVRKMHPVFKNIRVTHRWGGPILVTKTFRPVFRRHPRNKRVLILAGFSGHGVALSVYLGRWAAQSLLNLRPLPRWPA